MSRYKIRKVSKDQLINIMLSGKSFWIKETKEGVRYKGFVRLENYGGARIDRRLSERRRLLNFGFPECSLGKKISF